MKAAFLESRDRSPGEALEAVLEAVLAHASGRPLADDVTLLLIERSTLASA